MKQTTLLIIFALLITCGSSKSLSIEANQIELIEIYQGTETKVLMKEGFEKDFVADLNQSKMVGPTKFMKTYRIFIHYVDNHMDTVYSNGTIHNFKNAYVKSEENLIEKYSVQHNPPTGTMPGK